MERYSLCFNILLTSKHDCSPPGDLSDITFIWVDMLCFSNGIKCRNILESCLFSFLGLCLGVCQSSNFRETILANIGHINSNSFQEEHMWYSSRRMEQRVSLTTLLARPIGTLISILRSMICTRLRTQTLFEMKRGSNQ